MAGLPGQLTNGLRAFFAWWFGELAALVPAPLRRVFYREWEKLVLEFAADEVVVGRESGGVYREIGRVDVSTPDVAALRKGVSRLVRKAGRGRADVVVRLPASQVLQKTVRLPLAAEENLRGVLAFEMDRQTPFKATEVYYDFSVRGRDREAQLVEVALAVVPRTLVDAAVDRAVGWGLEPAIVDVAGDGSPRDDALNLLPKDENRPAAPGGGLTAAFGVLAAVLLAAAVYIPVDQARREAESLMAMVAEAKVEAESAIRLREEIDALAKHGRFLIDKKRQSATVTGTLDALTRLLPDDTWLLQLQLRGSEVVAAGYSPTASDLIGLIEQSPRFRNAKFRSIVTQDAKLGLERFNLSADIAQEVAP